MCVTSILTDYSVVILGQQGGVISRHAGTDLNLAILKAIVRRADFPNAKEIRVVCSAGVVATL